MPSTAYNLPEGWRRHQDSSPGFIEIEWSLATISGKVMCCFVFTPQQSIALPSDTCKTYNMRHHPSRGKTRQIYRGPRSAPHRAQFIAPAWEAYSAISCLMLVKSYRLNVAVTIRHHIVYILKIYALVWTWFWFYNTQTFALRKKARAWLLTLPTSTPIWPWVRVPSVTLAIFCWFI